MSSAKSIVISCAGIGSRLGLGQTKALLNINGKSLIAWQLEMFKDIEDVRIVIGYQANDIVQEVLKYRNDIIFIYNHNYFETKTGTSFYLGSKHAKEYVIEWDGDLLVHPEDVKKYC
ncbi:2-C-methyl-D-erythritol 4-phosphate cytidylyltransferase [termite gut metagenome]|uniref:2-C-methyl-D-erythritol 4-phosphate cytidylyltransferase n=1 Tax=termite gut metagenome TaxID=433724 RepID=A0A5J4QGU7_9ZZZZ